MLTDWRWGMKEGNESKMFLNVLALVNGRIKLQFTEMSKIVEGVIRGRWHEDQGFAMPVRYPSRQVKLLVGFINMEFMGEA